MLHRLSLLLLLLCSVSVAPATLTVYSMMAWGIRNDPVGHGDGYVKVYYNNRLFGTTAVRENTANPEWSERFSTSASSGNTLKLQLYDRDVYSDDPLGDCGTKIKTGSHSSGCRLSTGGKLEYSYSLR